MTNPFFLFFLQLLSVLALKAFLVPAVAADTSATAAAGSPPPAPDGFTWQAIPELSDEFDGNALDETKWMPKHAYWNGREPSAHDPANVSVKNGLLHLRNTTRTTTLDGIKNPEKDVWVQGRPTAPGN